MKGLINELNSLVDSTDNFIWDDGVVPSRAFGTKWVGHLVKPLQGASNKFEIYLIDLKNLDKKEESENKDIIF